MDNTVPVTLQSIRKDEDCSFARGLTTSVYEERANTLLSNMLHLPPHEPVALPHPPPWDADPYGDTNWRFQLHALRWAQNLKRRYDDTGDPGLIERYLTTLEDWYERNPWSAPPSDQSWGDHSTALRARVYAACAEALPRPWPLWLILALEEHLDVLSGPDLYPSGGNHALNQNVGLFAAATILGRTDEQQHAISRTADLLRKSVDHQGVTDEQSTEYQIYNYRRYEEARALFLEHGMDLPPIFDRVDLMTDLMTHATLPNGHDAMIGDSRDDEAHKVRGTTAFFAVTGRQKGPVPTERVRVFDRGYIFARTGWGVTRPREDETHISLRFGPPRIPHGHHDAGAITYFARGQRIISNAGKYAYVADDFRDYVLSRRAQNSILLTGVPYGPDGGSALVSAAADDRFVHAAVRDDHYPDAELVRTVVFDLEHGDLVVADRFGVHDKQAVSAEQRFRLDPSFAAVDTTQRTTTAVNPDRRLRVAITQLGDGDSTEIVRGQRSPLDGWVSYQYGVQQPTNVVIARVVGSSGLIATHLQVHDDAAPDDDPPVFLDRAEGTIDLRGHSFKMF